VKPGNYIIIVSSVGYIKQTSNITLTNKDLVLKRISLVENVEMLKGIEVKGTAAQMVVRGDTLEYNASAFQVPENAAVEDLMKKMPGVEIVDGKVTVNGEQIKNIRVDGKKFFSGDVEQAIKNLPADMIDKIQVLEQKSDMAQLTGFEDGDTERIINLTTKVNRRKGVFGNIGGGGGVDATLFEKGSVGDDARNNVGDHLRYTGNGTVNFMNGNSQTTITGGANNLNNSRGARGRGSWGSNGVSNNQNFGLNNNTIATNNLKFGGDVTINHSSNFNKNENYKETYSRDSEGKDRTDIDTSSSISRNNMWNANLRLETEWKIDTLNTIIIQPRMEYSTSKSSSARDYTYMYLNDLNENDTTSWGDSENYSERNSISGGLNVIYNHKFAAKKGRSLTMNVNTSFSQSGSDGLNFSEKYSKNNIGNIDTTIIDQKTINSSHKYSYSMRVSYVEPLWNLKNMLEISASYNNNTTNSVKEQYNRDATGDYSTEMDSIYSNSFQNIFHRGSVELNYSYKDEFYNIRLGLEGQPSWTKNLREYGSGIGNRDTAYSVLNFAPNARFQYNFGRKTFVRIDYRGRTQQPDIDQMQPVKNNSDPMNETVGNPALNPSFNHDFRLMYSAFFDSTFASLSTVISASMTKDALGSNRIYNEHSKQYSQTINIPNLPLNLGWSIMYNTPLISKLLHFNTNTNFGYRMQYAYVLRGVNDDEINQAIDNNNFMRGQENSTKSGNVSESISLTLTHEFIELGLRGNVNYSHSQNTMRKDPTKTWNWGSTGNLVLRLPYDFTISSDITYSDRKGYSGGMNQQEIMWNATLDKQLFKKKATLKFQANDILHQRLSIRQTIGDNYIQNSRYNTLPSYFLLTFTYQIKGFGAGNSRGNRREGFRGGDAPVGIPPGGYQGGGIRMGGGMPM
ncbi:MAG: outer membrane beta-barrel protein, partial [Paludibacter sp.]|nr:outer membrane beta-barrel protein [Paludibacter sp.]